MEKISSEELAKRSGASYRQIDYWTRHGIFGPVGNATPGSGHPRRYDAKIVPRVRLLSNVSKAFGGDISHSNLHKIYRAYPRGSVSFGRGIKLSWKVER